jgi:hypothetical protein
MSFLVRDITTNLIQWSVVCQRHNYPRSSPYARRPFSVERNTTYIYPARCSTRDAFVENSSPLDARHRFSHPACSLVFYGRWVTAGAYLLEAANPRHEHEWKIWKEAKLSEGKILIGKQGTLAVTGCSVAGRHRDATIPIHHSGLRATATS